jgi:hypothetical protein
LAERTSKEYGDACLENEIDGAMLEACKVDAELDTLLQELGVAKLMHRKKILIAMKKKFPLLASPSAGNETGAVASDVTATATATAAALVPVVPVAPLTFEQIINSESISLPPRQIMAEIFKNKG